MVRVAPINLTFNPRTLWFDPGDLDIEKDMPVVVRTARGTEFGIAASEVIEVSEEQVRALKSALRPVERIATEEDIEPGGRDGARFRRGPAGVQGDGPGVPRGHAPGVRGISARRRQGRLLLQRPRSASTSASWYASWRPASTCASTCVRSACATRPAWWAASGTAARSCAASGSAGEFCPGVHSHGQGAGALAEPPEDLGAVRAPHVLSALRVRRLQGLQWAALPS